MVLYRIDEDTIIAENVDGKKYIIKWPENKNISTQVYSSIKSFILSLGEEEL